MKLNRKLLTILLLLVLPVFLTACTLKDIPLIGGLFGGGTGPAKKPTTITMWGLWEQGDVMDAAIAKYKEKNPQINVVYDDRTITDLGSYKETVASRTSQPDFTDVVLVHNSWVGQLSSGLDPVPPEVFTSEQYSNAFYPSAVQSAKVGEQLFAVPLFYDGIALVYNKDHFDSIGQKNPPTSWEEFRRIAERLTDVEDDRSGNAVKVNRYGAAIGTADNIDFFPDILSALFHQAGALIPNDFEKQKSQDALSFYVKFAKDYRVWSSDMPEASKAFAAGKVSMIFVPSWNLADILMARPDMNIGVAPLPQISTNPEDHVSNASFWMLAVPAGSKNKSTAWDFIKFLASEDAQLTIHSEALNYRIYGAPYSLKSLKTQLISSEYLEPILRQADSCGGVCNTTSAISLLSGRSGNVKQVGLLRDAVNKLLTDPKVTPLDALKEAKAAFFK
ncbi:hypothetical protein A3K34_04485 [candidate division WWE3 bacterium RIFOXYC1_FULL_40_10]|uniref:ABC transporter substrate-binding protein n=1 Tax=candidate division WWE3 bacterium RIFOXYA2_FULL_46_9 TaxID=1802636 RepID=A0A1F4W190_UNCKA|nr:MAG: hypothetical protein A3K58_04485 [candidate division WWE3 bacterium RIFOXYB1_FULL_40_22]OGC62100.1 MAG: hypothetical protein A3K37_04485 [candidate division WWE3 bacterium RIFOXYA1_FULL_40_11]OGC63115.1 MAG: hypothetical protein A2264_00230 [candidate division WWE3 bacterium RIFOXYA2_FULL_46_9]OGC64957.1 MAG: hypothetical protein A2326_02880 [candidate division WWE3 bacterium RIFOXYB2_FULL_41_6]OGC66483.1 MAG: hypothetical protein A3K34_04485 [candidate division WWE3 bacterium RIFOXYC1_